MFICPLDVMDTLDTLYSPYAFFSPTKEKVTEITTAATKHGYGLSGGMYLYQASPIKESPDKVFAVGYTYIPTDIYKLLDSMGMLDEKLTGCYGSTGVVDPLIGDGTLNVVILTSILQPGDETLEKTYSKVVAKSFVERLRDYSSLFDENEGKIVEYIERLSWMNDTNPEE